MKTLWYSWMFVFSFFGGFTVKLKAQQNGKYYRVNDSIKMFFPLGDFSFADKITSYKKGNPSAIKSASDSSKAIGIPDFDGINAGFVSLGCRGELTLAFIDNALVNVSGPDLYVFEQGKYIESTTVYISKDAKNWIYCGKIKGGTATIDIGNSTKPGETFNYVKLIDEGTDCKGKWPGADIDAVAAIGSGKQFNLDASVLFDVNKFELKPGAKTELDKVVAFIKEYPSSDIIISGHTDNSGDTKKNQLLSENRAKAVRSYLVNKLGKNTAQHITCYGYGEIYPVAPNDTDGDKAKNRRVEVVIIPVK